MKHLLIENKGELDISSLILIGASTKREDSSKIGFFGSGNKYAIATLIRTNTPFKIFSGEREVIVTTEEVNFRNVMFKKIIIDGFPTSLTTDMGPQWEEWMCIREWVSNSIDEGDSRIVKETNLVEGQVGYTRFYVEHTPNVNRIVNNWNNLFTYERTDEVYSSGSGKIFSQSNKDESLILFRRGIKVYENKDKKSLFHYDINAFHINESRIVSSFSIASNRVSEYLGHVEDVSIIKKILRNCTSNSEYFEAHLDWRWSVYHLSEAWAKAIEGKYIVVDAVAEFFEDIVKTKPCYLVTMSMASMLLRNMPKIKVYGINEEGDEFIFKPVEKTNKMETLLTDAVDFLNKTQYVIKYPIEIVSFQKQETLGAAHSGKILLSENVFSLGKKELVSTIIEENEHLSTGMADCTRSFQSHFINLFLSEKEDRFSVYL